MMSEESSTTSGMKKTLGLTGVTVNAIKTAAYTGEKGDGMIFVYPVENVIRISTDEEGHDAIMYQGDIDARRQDQSDTL
jgi:hypothetical protein